MEERPLPWARKRLAIVLTALSILLGIWACWFTLHHPLRGLYYLLLALIPFGVIRYFHYHRRRCPECGNRLVLRRDPIAGTWRYRMMLDCSHCRIAWNTGDIQDDAGAS
jgi:hypothetical protein